MKTEVGGANSITLSPSSKYLDSANGNKLSSFLPVRLSVIPILSLFLIEKYNEKNGTYSSVGDSGRKKRKDRKKIQRFHTTIDTESSDSDDNDWLKSTMKKESRML